MAAPSPNDVLLRRRLTVVTTYSRRQRMRLSLAYAAGRDPDARPAASPVRGAASRSTSLVKHPKQQQPPREPDEKDNDDYDDNGDDDDVDDDDDDDDDKENVPTPVNRLVSRPVNRPVAAAATGKKNKKRRRRSGTKDAWAIAGLEGVSAVEQEIVARPVFRSPGQARTLRAVRSPPTTTTGPIVTRYQPGLFDFGLKDVPLQSSPQQRSPFTVLQSSSLTTLAAQELSPISALASHDDSYDNGSAPPPSVGRITQDPFSSLSSSSSSAAPAPPSPPAIRSPPALASPPVATVAPADSDLAWHARGDMSDASADELIAAAPAPSHPVATLWMRRLSRSLPDGAPDELL